MELRPFAGFMKDTFPRSLVTSFDLGGHYYDKPHNAIQPKGKLVYHTSPGSEAPTCFCVL